MLPPGFGSRKGRRNVTGLGVHLVVGRPVVKDQDQDQERATAETKGGIQEDKGTWREGGHHAEGVSRGMGAWG